MVLLESNMPRLLRLSSTAVQHGQGKMFQTVQVLSYNPASVCSDSYNLLAKLTHFSHSSAIRKRACARVLRASCH